MQEKQKRNLEVNEQVFKTTKDSCNDLEDLTTNEDCIQ